MLKVSITSDPVEVIRYTNKAGQAAELRKQTGYLHSVRPDGTPAPFPDRFGFLLNRDQAPYPAGEYQLHPSAVTVDRDGRLSCASVLTPAKR